MRVAGVLSLILALASSCGPNEADDDVDAGGDALVTGREFNVDCTPERYEVRQPNGDVTAYVTWSAYVDQPFDWHGVQYRLCDPRGEAANLCPTGATCTGTRPTAPFCTAGAGARQDTGGADRGRISCGTVTEFTPSGGATTANGTYYRLAQIHVD